MKKLLFLIILFNFSVFAQEKVYVFDSFSGGLNTKQSNLSIQKSQSIIAENVRLNSEVGSLVKRDEVLLYGTVSPSEPITGMHRLYLKSGTKKLIVTHGDEVAVGNDTSGNFTTILNLTSGDYRSKWLTWHDLAIGTDGYNQPIKYDGSSGSATYLGSCLATDTGAGNGPGNGTYTYKVAFYTNTSIVDFGVASNPVVVANNTVNLTMIPIGPDSFGGETVLGRHIYRANATTYKLITNGNITDNVNVTLSDSTVDADLGATLAANYTYTVPKGKIPIVHKNRLWLFNDPNQPSRGYYSDDSNPDYFITGNYFDIRPNDGDEVTFAKNLLGILTVSKTNTIQKLYTDGDDPDADWSISDPISMIGCQAIYSAVDSPLGIIYLARDGIYRFNGQNSIIISDIVTPEIKDIADSNFANSWGELYRNVYYLSYASKQSGTSTNNRILLYDLLSNAFSIDLFSSNVFCTLNSGTDWGMLYSGSSTDGKVYSHTNVPNEVVHKSHSDFTGSFNNTRYIPVNSTSGVPLGGIADDPVIEISRTELISEMSGNISSQTGSIGRSVNTSNYTSPVMQLGATSFDKIYWNERFPSSGGDITFAIRANTTNATCNASSWSDEFTNPSGSDISAITANEYVQYRATMNTTDMAYTPTLYKANGYVVKLLYKKTGIRSESTVPLHYRSGWFDLGSPVKKSLTKIYVFHEGTTGTLTLKFSNFEGDFDTFNINLAEYPYSYSEYFTTGKLVGELFNLDITETSLNPVKIKKIILIYKDEPFV